MVAQLQMRLYFACAMRNVLVTALNKGSFGVELLRTLAKAGAFFLMLRLL